MIKDDSSQSGVVAALYHMARSIFKLLATRQGNTHQ